MRILMLAQFYPPTIGGEERHVRNLSIELAARGHDVSLATLWHNGQPDYEIDQGVRVHRIRGTMQRVGALFSEQERQYAPPFPDPEALNAIRHLIAAERPDIVHAHNWIVHSFTPLKAWSKARLVVTLHDYSLICVQKRLTYQNAICSGPTLTKCLRCANDFYGPALGLPSTITNWLSGMAERRAVDMFLPVSSAVAEGTGLANYRVPYRVIPNFVPDNISMLRNDEDPHLAQLPSEDFLLFVGDVKRDKGVGVLLQAYAALQYPIPLVLIGRIGKEFAGELPPGVRALQGWPHEAVMAAWNRCTLALAPSIWPDPCPTVAMEAMSASKPVIASRIGGLTDIVADNETGLLVTPNDPDTLRDAIQCLLDDPARTQQMGEQARQRVKAFQAASVVSLIEEVYREISA
ncbi:MAG TPA: glycosyltransferase family 4 protein [Ktedonobacteraceae bacterium]